MSIDWDAHLLAPVMSVFGETVTYTPQSKPPFALSAVFDEAYHPLTLGDDAPQVTTEIPVLGIRLAQFPNGSLPRKGDTVAVPSVHMVFTVRDVHPDGHGHAKLLLTELRAMS